MPSVQPAAEAVTVTVVSMTAVSPVSDSGNDLQIGRRADIALEYLTGQVSGPRVYAAGLTGEEVKALFLMEQGGGQ